MDNLNDSFQADSNSTAGAGGGLPLPKERNLYFTSQVDQASIAALSRSIIEINANDVLLKKQYAVYGIDYKPTPIKIYIDSYGGYVYQCFGLLSVMEHSVTPIHTIVTGAAMSCGFMMAISGHKRFAYKHSTLMYHQVSSWAGGKLKDMVEDIEETKRLQDVIEAVTLKKTNISLTTLKDVYSRKFDWFMDADQALKNGCIDAIIS